MLKICFIGNISIPFQRDDYQILKKHYNVELIQPPKKKIDWLKYPLMIKKKVKKSDIIFCWFAGWHSCFSIYYSNRFNKKSLVVVGGYDVENMPEINYGAFTNIKEKIASNYVLKNSNLLLPFSDYAVKNLQMLKKTANFKKIYLFCDSDKFSLKGKKENIVITVGGLKSKNLKRKGLENFVKSAKYIPNIKFILVGKFIDDSIDYLKSIATDNVEFTGFINEEKLIDLYQKSKVYCQLSYQEGFGIALAESMLCGAIPVVTKRGAISEVVGDKGFYVPFGNHKATADAIKKALTSDRSLVKKVRERIMNNFNIQKRENELINTINNFIEVK
jgi:glycosyltransferase involved in cell wall biosynthesis